MISAYLIYINKVLQIFKSNLLDSGNDEIICDLVEILKIAIQYQYYDLITPEEILDLAQDDEIDDSQRIKMLSLLPFYDIHNGNTKYSRTALKKIRGIVSMLAGSEDDNKCEKLDRLYYIDKHELDYSIDYSTITGWTSRTSEILMNLIFDKFHWDSDQKHIFRDIFDKFEIEHGFTGFCMTKNWILDSILSIKSTDNSISFNEIWNMIQLWTDGNFDVRIIVSSSYIKSETEFKYIMSEASKCKIGRMWVGKQFDSSKIEKISRLFDNTNWSLAMITKFFKFTTDFNTSTDLVQFLEFVNQNNFPEKLTLFLINELVENIEEDAWFLEQLKYLMIEYHIKILLKDKFQNHSNLMLIGFK